MSGVQQKPDYACRYASTFSAIGPCTQRVSQPLDICLPCYTIVVGRCIKLNKLLGLNTMELPFNTEDIDGRPEEYA